MRPNLSTLIVLLVVVAGCAEDPKSPSRVESLRILGLKPTPTNPMPGDTLALAATKLMRVARRIALLQSDKFEHRGNFILMLRAGADFTNNQRLGDYIADC